MRDPEKLRQNTRRWRARNLERCRQTSRDWKDRHRAWNRVRDRRRKEAKRNPLPVASPFHLKDGGDG